MTAASAPRAGRELFSRQVLEYLESVFSANPHPEDLVKYELHKLLGLELRQINDWFHNRRQKERKRKLAEGEQAAEAAYSPDNSCKRSRPTQQAPPLPAVNFAISPDGSSAAHERKVPAGIGTSNTADAPRQMPSTNSVVGECSEVGAQPSKSQPEKVPTWLARIQQPINLQSSPFLSSSLVNHAPFSRQQQQQQQQQLPLHHHSALPKLPAATAGLSLAPHLSKLQPISSSARPAAEAGIIPINAANAVRNDIPVVEAGCGPLNDCDLRFTAADMPLVSQLIGLQQVACSVPPGAPGQNQPDGGMYLFEQITSLDSLGRDNPVSGSKRSRSRHQHFWRNSDKVPAEDRLYLVSKEATAALQGGPPAVGRTELPASQRSNIWTVALTANGCVDYLNRKISPIGVRMLRALIAQQMAFRSLGMPASVSLQAAEGVFAPEIAAAEASEAQRSLRHITAPIAALHQLASHPPRTTDVGFGGSFRSIPRASQAPDRIGGFLSQAEGNYGSAPATSLGLAPVRFPSASSAALLAASGAGRYSQERTLRGSTAVAAAGPQVSQPLLSGCESVPSTTASAADGNTSGVGGGSGGGGSNSNLAVGAAHTALLALSTLGNCAESSITPLDSSGAAMMPFISSTVPSRKSVPVESRPPCELSPLQSASSSHNGSDVIQQAKQVLLQPPRHKEAPTLSPPEPMASLREPMLLLPSPSLPSMPLVLPPPQRGAHLPLGPLLSHQTTPKEHQGGNALALLQVGFGSHTHAVPPEAAASQQLWQNADESPVQIYRQLMQQHAVPKAPQIKATAFGPTAHPGLTAASGSCPLAQQETRGGAIEITKQQSQRAREHPFALADRLGLPPVCEASPVAIDHQQTAASDDIIAKAASIIGMRQQQSQQTTHHGGRGSTAADSQSAASSAPGTTIDSGSSRSGARQQSGTASSEAAAAQCDAVPPIAWADGWASHVPLFSDAHLKAAAAGSLDLGELLMGMPSHHGCPPECLPPLESRDTLVEDTAIGMSMQLPRQQSYISDNATSLAISPLAATQDISSQRSSPRGEGNLPWSRNQQPSLTVEQQPTALTRPGVASNGSHMPWSSNQQSSPAPAAG